MRYRYWRLSSTNIFQERCSTAKCPKEARKQTSGNELARALRMAFEYAHFVLTELYSRIRTWEADNSPYRIIRDYPAERTTP